MNLSLTSVLTWYPSYFTNWILFYYCIFIYWGFPKEMMFMLLLLVNVGLVGGFYITYVYPRYIYVSEFDLIIDGYFLCALDFVFHVLPAVHINLIYRKTGTMIGFLYFVVLGTMYMLTNDFTDKYGLAIKDAFIVIQTGILLSLTREL